VQLNQQRSAFEVVMAGRGNLKLIASIGAACAALLFSAASASAASLNVIDSADYADILGAEVDSMTSTIDGVDGTITSTVYEGIGAADGYFVYTYQIVLSDSSTSSVDSVMFEFGSVPANIAGIGDSFYVDDGSGNVAPSSSTYVQSSETAGFEFQVNIGAGETSLEFGLFSEIAPAISGADIGATTASGGRRTSRGPTATTGTATVLSNGVAPVPEPTSAVVFALGFAVVAATCRAKSSRN
jgi:hypothetical protein